MVIQKMVCYGLLAHITVNVWALLNVWSLI